jgi:Primase X
MLKAYEESDFIDSKLNAYPSYTEYKGIKRYPPNFIFADLDLLSFRDPPTLERTLAAALRTIRLKINGSPTVLWSGNGYHIYQPIDAIILEEFEQFEEFEHPSTKFLRFAEYFLTNGKCDPSHSPSLKSCMIRVPGSLNSKYAGGKSEVKIIQKWDGYRPPMNMLINSFHVYLVEQKVKEDKLRKRIEKKFGTKGDLIHSISWIEILLQTPIEDYRKNAIGLILAPYLINIRKFSYEMASVLIKDWLRKCNQVRTLDFNYEHKVKYCLNTSIRKMQLPWKFDTLKTKNNELYVLLSLIMLRKSNNDQIMKID